MPRDSLLSKTKTCLKAAGVAGCTRAHLVEQTGLTYRTISNHLRALKARDLVEEDTTHERGAKKIWRWRG